MQASQTDRQAGAAVAAGGRTISSFPAMQAYPQQSTRRVIAKTGVKLSMYGTPHPQLWTQQLRGLC